MLHKISKRFVNSSLIQSAFSSSLIEGNGLETWQSSLLYVFVRYFGADPAQNLTKYKRWLRVFIQVTNKSIAIMYFMHSQ